jgi:hypothetical protein
MNPKVKAMFAMNKDLQRQSLRNYRKILSSLLDVHAHHEMFDGLKAAFRSKDYRRLIDEADSLSQQKHSDAALHFAANQFALIVKKYPFDPVLTGLDARLAAKETFLRSERRSSRMNRKFSFLNGLDFRDPYLREARRARAFLRSILGDSPNYDRCLRGCDFGPGASVGTHGNATNIIRKLMSSWTVSPSALHLSYKAMRMNHHLYEGFFPKFDGETPTCFDDEYAFKVYLSRLEMCEHNNISFVPKTAKTERTIAVEPLLNGFVQKGIDQELRKKLLRFGIDLSNQEINQNLALLGSFGGLDPLVTIDLKSASDSISRELVRYLLPYDWYRFLDNSRSKYYKLEGAVYPYQKFCSMGNGFCFPLETLIFVAAIVATGKVTNPQRDFHVYGDDIIVRSSVSAEIIDLLDHWGFKTNLDKTFLEGPFRESCGADWFGGEDVRPFTLDYALDSYQNIVKFLNLSTRSRKTSSFFEPVRGLVTSFLQEDFRLYRPFTGTDDSAITSTGDEHLSCKTCHFKNGKWSWMEIISEPIVDLSMMEYEQAQVYLCGVALRGAVSLNGSPVVTFRNKTKTKITRKSYSSTSNWLPAQYR